ncbi:uncharacterized protein CPUR_01347 [Claviceps purpurea 20.1]|uniref:Reverse transcriptase Ty1/copia-type domain-containing protein n=1 Tax=Claviceps purpurea (strain 20.1) TaxID=1111077 RepID=M1W6H1_CLAP2|nr:uncharacterized protein CPUR_01347 [Claviceps purpurea 20.1]
MAEIESLLAQDVFVFIIRPQSPQGRQTIPVPNRFGDQEAEFILTQSPKIQRLSQRLIVALAPYLSARQIWLWIRDITQAYVQATSKLQREILVQLPKEIRHRYGRKIVMRVIKPLYGKSGAGTHWWVTYFGHHLAKLLMETSTYDPCLLVTTEESDCFGIIGMQTDDTLGLGDKAFFDREEVELQKANFAAKPKTSLTHETPLRFNGCMLIQTENHCIYMTQKGQSDKLNLVAFDATDMKQKYVEQRTRGAYVATVCQPEAVYDLAVAAQAQDRPTTT